MMSNVPVLLSVKSAITRYVFVVPELLMTPTVSATPAAPPLTAEAHVTPQFAAPSTMLSATLALALGVAVTFARCPLPTAIENTRSGPVYPAQLELLS